MSQPLDAAVSVPKTFQEKFKARVGDIPKAGGHNRCFRITVK